MRAIEFKTIEEAEQVAIELHEFLKNEDGYTSESYGNPKETINNTWLLFELKGFERQLKGYSFKDVDLKVIKKQEEI